MSFDLNITNYTTAELEELFDLPNGYTLDLLELKNEKLKKNIISNKQIQEEIRPKILSFLEHAKKIILNGFRKLEQVGDKIETLHHTYQDVYNLDKTLQPSDTIADGGTFIIKKPSTPYGQSKPSEFYEGIINPLNNRILRKNVNIDTRFRSNYYSTVSSNFHVDLPFRFTQVVSMQLSAFEFPASFYAISKVFGNNFFFITIQNTDQLIEVPDGNYTNQSLMQYLNNTMQTFASSASPVLSLLQYIYFTIDDDFNSGSGKMIVSLSDQYAGSEPVVFSLNFKTDRNGTEDRVNPLPLKLGWLFGFREGLYINNTVYVSEGLVDLKGPRYIYLVVDDFNNNVNDGFYGAFNSSILNKNILARISLQGTFFNLLSQNNLSLITYARQYFGPVDIQKLQIQLLDEYGRIIDLNNMDYSFCLTFQSIYDL